MDGRLATTVWNDWQQQLQLHPQALCVSLVGSQALDLMASGISRVNHAESHFHVRHKPCNPPPQVLHTVTKYIHDYGPATTWSQCQYHRACSSGSALQGFQAEHVAIAVRM